MTRGCRFPVLILILSAIIRRRHKKRQTSPSSSQLTCVLSSSCLAAMTGTARTVLGPRSLVFVLLGGVEQHSHRGSESSQPSLQALPLVGTEGSVHTPTEEKIRVERTN